jgi:amino acid adenylation domain-containing protein
MSRTDRTLPSLFERRVAEAPGEIAIVSDDGELTYAALNGRANRLAHRLIDDGVGPESVVALILPRSPEAVVAMLAVLKAGGAYLPVDPAYPQERIAYLLADAKPDLVLDGVPALAGLPEENPRRRPLSPSHPAYVIYTSGSTGTPKGVTGLHEGLVNRLEWFASRFPDQRGRRVLAKTSPGFIDGTTEVFGTLTTGGTLVFPAAGGLPAQVAAHRIDRLTVVPSLLRTLLAEPDSLSGCGFWISSGERLDGELATATKKALPGARLINLYGCSEVSGDSLWAEYTGGDDVPIGVPIDGTRAHVLDARLRPSTEGELYLAGAGLARGYRGRPDLTAARFVAEPGGPAGGRMYRTGDLVRRRADGTLVFVGRADDQIALHGFRVEPAEVEAVLGTHPSVARAAVAKQGEDLLVGYVVAAPGTSVVPEDVRRHAAESLPAHLVPSIVLVLGELPTTPSGKLDRRALPSPEFRANGREPRDEHEKRLCGLFSEVLDVPEVGIDDEFLALGGHSLSAAKLVNRARAELGVELDVTALLDGGTVAKLGVRAGESRPPLTAGPRPGKIPLSPTQQRLWFSSRLEGTSAVYNLPYALRISGEVNEVALTAALSDVVARHESLRTTFPDDDGVPCQSVRPPEPPVVEKVHCGPEELPSRIRAAVRHEFDLVAEPPLRVTLFVTDDEERVLLLLTHHIATDGWSMAPLVHDLGVAYSARLDGGPPDWAPLPVQYADHTLWQRDFLGDERNPGGLLARQTEFWAETLEDLPAELEIPLDRPRPAVPTGRGGLVEFTVDAGTHRGIRELAAAHDATTFMVLHAALSALLTRMGAGTDLPIGTVVAGRGDRALEDVVGFFANTLVLRGDTSGNPRFTELLTRVRAADLAAYGNQDTPFDHLVGVLNPLRSPSRHPLFQILLLLDNTAPVQPRLRDLRAEPYPVESAFARFDLAFEFAERTGSAGRPRGMTGSLEYSADLFDRTSVEQWAERLVRVLEAVVADPGTRIGRIDILGTEERRELLGK